MSDNQEFQDDLDPVTPPSTGDDLAAATQTAASEEADATDTARDELKALLAQILAENKHVNLDPEDMGFKPTKIPDDEPSLIALKVGADDLSKILDIAGLSNITKEQAAALSPEKRRLLSLASRFSPIYQDDYFNGVDAQGDWGGYAQHGDTKVRGGRIAAVAMKDPVMSIRAAFGLGGQVTIPLWNTGIWITLRAPSLKELIDLDQRVRMEKITLGRASNGLAFSNTEVYTVEAYSRFVLEHVVATNYQLETDDTVTELMGVILNRDYQHLLLGMLSAMYPDGYPLRQPCVANYDKCNHIDEVMLNFGRLHRIDRTKLTEDQVRRMASRTTKRDAKWLSEYQSGFAFFEKRVACGKGLTAVLRVPTLAEQIAAGRLWVDGIAKATQDAFGARLSEVDRIEHIMRTGIVTSLRQHSHWISHFEHVAIDGEEPRIIDDFVQKDEILEVLSDSVEVSTKFTTELMGWIRQSTVDFVGLPKYKCPGCQKDAADHTHPHLIPLDVGYVFFTLAALKISLRTPAAQ